MFGPVPVARPPVEARVRDPGKPQGRGQIPEGPGRGLERRRGIRSRCHGPGPGPRSPRRRRRRGGGRCSRAGEASGARATRVPLTRRWLRGLERGRAGRRENPARRHRPRAAAATTAAGAARRTARALRGRGTRPEPSGRTDGRAEGERGCRASGRPIQDGARGAQAGRARPRALSRGALAPGKPAPRGGHGAAFVAVRRAVKILRVCGRLCTWSVPDQAALEAEDLEV